MTRQRLVGILALVSLAILLAPLVFRGDPQERELLLRPIPPMPPVEVPDFDADAALAEMEKLRQEGENMGRPDETANLPEAWTLQAGSFAEEPNAVRLRDKLREAGHHAYALRIPGDRGAGDDRIRVMVGPMLSRDDLEEIAESIRQDFGIQAQMQRYRMEDDMNIVGG